eukprot:GILJ01008421.1.p1 GENE.GILJ01008421.1~~GILJ01008421.1.p1  ORF type:complete len:284 (-),score=23.63 GILJ01008421.1:184-1035(-)
MDSIFRRGLFDGRVALITGGGTGIGLYTARELAYLGATVILASRKLENLQKGVTQIRAEGGVAHAVQCNIRDRRSIENCVDQCIAIAGRVDFLVNNGGGQFPSPASDISEKGWKAVVETNLTGTFMLSQEVFNRVFRNNNFGVIVNVIVDFWNGFPGMAHTAAARAGVETLSKTLSIEWASAGVRVNCVAPGVINSSGLQSYGASIAEAISKEQPTRNYAYRLGTEAETAAAIIFLLSPAASFIVGSTVRVDGGAPLYNPNWTPTPHTNSIAWQPSQIIRSKL